MNAAEVVLVGAVFASMVVCAVSVYKINQLHELNALLSSENKFLWDIVEKNRQTFLRIQTIAAAIKEKSGYTEAVSDKTFLVPGDKKGFAQ